MTEQPIIVELDITPSECEPDRCPYWWFEQANARWRCKINNIPALEYVRQDERNTVLNMIRLFRGGEFSNVSWYERWYLEEEFLNSLRSKP